MAWQFSSDRPIFLQLADQIVSSIITGEYSMGQKLPSVREFAEMTSVNPNTVQRALSELEAAGLVTNQRTTGKFVTDEEERIFMAKEKRGRTLAADFIKSMAALGYTTEQTIRLLSESSGKGEEENE